MNNELVVCNERLRNVLKSDKKDNPNKIIAVCGCMTQQKERAEQIKKTFESGKGIFRLAPNWVPRSFCIPGRRIKLHPDDYYALGGERGGIDERWLGCTTPADNGPLTGKNEGISHLVADDGTLIPLTEAVELLGAELIGERLWNQYHCWPVYSKFFDNLGPLPHHIHHREEHAKLVGQRGKPECYYFPPQLNNHGGHFPFTFFGFEPGTTKEQVKECLKNFTKGDNKITNLSKAYRLEPGTGWDVPPGLLHAPGSLCTYEPQFASDVYAMWQSLVDDQIVTEELLWKDCPPEKRGDYDYLISNMDWELNVDPEFMAHRRSRGQLGLLQKFSRFRQRVDRSSRRNRGGQRCGGIRSYHDAGARHTERQTAGNSGTDPFRSVDL